jgi:hypothetical protein
MGYRNAFDVTGENQATGEKAEFLFEKIAKSKGFLTKSATLKQQLSHIDFIVETKDKKSYTFDVKGRKRITRKDASVTDEMVWIEFKNVQGKNGWLYGAADFIAFERELDFVIISRNNLVTLCERIVQNKKVSSPNDALYAKFTRPTRKDELSLIKMDDILKGAKTYIWQK